MRARMSGFRRGRLEEVELEVEVEVEVGGR